MIKAIAVDDNKVALKVIEAYSKEIDFLQLEKTFDDAKEALNYVNNYPVDLVFLDIEMPEINGLEFSKKIKQDAMVVFTTSHTEYAIEGFNLNAVDYLLKPYTPERMKQAAEKAKLFFGSKSQADNAENKQHIYLRADYALHKIALADITYIEALDDYLKIHIENRKTLVVRLTMKEMTEKLKYGQFIRVHRSYIVSIPRIESLRNKVLIVAGASVPTGAKYEKELLELFPNGKE